MDPIRAMSYFLTFTFSIILSLTLLKPPYAVANESIHVAVQNGFSDGRTMDVLCFSNQGSTSHARQLLNTLLVQYAIDSWTVSSSNTETVNICYVSWKQRCIDQVRFKFLAFKSSWFHDYNSLKNPGTGDLAYVWAFNETGFFRFDFWREIYILLLPLKQLMSSAEFHHPVNILVTNGFSDGRVIAISSYLNQGVNVDAPIANDIALHGHFVNWLISRFNTRTINTCKVGWLHSNRHDLEFEAFVGGWRIDESRINPWTGEVRFDWHVNDTGVYLLNFTTTHYELKKSLLHPTHTIP